MKLFIVITLTLSLLMALLTGCNNAPADSAGSAGLSEGQSAINAQDPENGAQHNQPVDSGRQLSIICTIFPQYDWTRQILGEHMGQMELTLLQDTLIDLHSYVPSMSDMVRIYSSDLFIYIGGESDDWVSDVLGQATNPDMVVINLMEALGDMLKHEEELEGADSHSHDDDYDNHDDDDDHDDDDYNDYHDDDHYDEHIWLSLKNAQVLAAVIADALSQLDPARSADYHNNLNAYIERLNMLDDAYHQALDDVSVRTLLFGSRFPFRYLLDDYDLNYYAAFSGCSAETEASFGTIAFLAGKVNEHNLQTIMVTECSDQSIAGTIISNSRDGNQQILVLNAMQSVTAGDVENGITFLSIMEDNLNVLIDALS